MYSIMCYGLMLLREIKLINASYRDVLLLHTFHTKKIVIAKSIDHPYVHIHTVWTACLVLFDVFF